ncbi:MAG: SEC-C metal-binding domain-containing protein [Deltaproteobacteria bacterium]|nr:SEC-C metal-binding domain-containing protein [Deltaproteobacteria bacterium]
MPPAGSRSFTLQSNGGLLNQLITDIEIAPAFDPATAAQQTNPYKPYKALWDTGATGTVITKKIVDDLGLKQIGITKVFHGDGSTDQPVYYINIMLPHRVAFSYIRATEGKLTGFDVLVGMDIIVKGDFAITNSDGKTTFSFRIPSEICIDFVKEHNSKNAPPRVGRNDPCSCGSGKKYKKCHGK